MITAASHNISQSRFVPEFGDVKLCPGFDIGLYVNPARSSLSCPGVLACYKGCDNLQPIFEANFSGFL